MIWWTFRTFLRWDLTKEILAKWTNPWIKLLCLKIFWCLGENSNNNRIRMFTKFKPKSLLIWTTTRWAKLNKPLSPPNLWAQIFLVAAESTTKRLNCSRTFRLWITQREDLAWCKATRWSLTRTKCIKRDHRDHKLRACRLETKKWTTQNTLIWMTKWTSKIWRACRPISSKLMECPRGLAARKVWFKRQRTTNY